MSKCPRCHGRLRRHRHFRLYKYCPRCGWSEREQLEDKIREELANGDGLDE